MSRYGGVRSGCFCRPARKSANRGSGSRRDPASSPESLSRSGSRGRACGGQSASSFSVMRLPGAGGRVTGAAVLAAALQTARSRVSGRRRGVPERRERLTTALPMRIAQRYSEQRGRVRTRPLRGRLKTTLVTFDTCRVARARQEARTVKALPSALPDNAKELSKAHFSSQGFGCQTAANRHRLAIRPPFCGETGRPDRGIACANARIQ